MGVCYPNADSYRDLDPDQTFRQHETEKKNQHAMYGVTSRVSYIHAISFQHGRWNGGGM